MGYRDYRRKHTIQISHYRNVRERWQDFKVKVKIFCWGVFITATIVLVLVNKR